MGGHLPTIDYWKKFLNAFTAELSRLSDREFSDAWMSSGNRTSLYEDRILKQVAGAMGLVFRKEEFKIDYTLCKSTDRGYDVPLVFVESENVANSAHHEIRKLSCLHAPLKVLIVCAEWSDEPGAWKHGGFKESLLARWGSQVRAHNKEWPSPCITGVLVAEWNQCLRYYALAFDHFGEIADEHRVVFERTIS